MDPLFNHLIESGFLTSLDLYFAQVHGSIDDAQRAFLAAVMQASREGHLCLDLDELATPEQKWKELVLEGAKRGVESSYLVREEQRVYLQKNYQYETDILEEIRRLAGKEELPRAKAIHPNNVKNWNFDNEASQILHQGFDPNAKSEKLHCQNSNSSHCLGITEEQQVAFDLVQQEKMSIIAGGPGTGKTHLIGELVKSFGLDVILAAPTGKAAGRLREKNPGVLCGTLHAILGIKSEKDMEKRRYIRANLVVVDEASMVDVKMMRVLLKSLQEGQRIVFLGDGHQLPPVESGTIFNDLIGSIPTAYLQTCLRSDRKEILELATSILKGEKVLVNGFLSFETIKRFVREGYAVLTPVREGPWGVKELNYRLDQEFQGLKKPIMITRNDRETGLSNGDMGTLVFEGERATFALFEIGKVPINQLPPYELAYVLSIHKSQGSEFDHVLVLAPPGIEAFGREALYTAATRARLSVTLLGEESVIAQALKSSSCKKSGIRKRLAKSSFSSVTEL